MAKCDWSNDDEVLPSRGMETQFSHVTPVRQRKSLGEALESGKFSDFTLELYDGSLKVHRIILATSCPFFERMFSLDVELASCTEIIGWCRASAMRAVAGLLYTGECSVPSNDLGLFLHAAFLLELGSIIDQCKDIQSQIEVHAVNYEPLWEVLQGRRDDFQDLWPRVEAMKETGSKLRKHSLIAFSSNIETGNVQKNVTIVGASGTPSRFSDVGVSFDRELSLSVVKSDAYIFGVGSKHDKIYKCTMGVGLSNGVQCGTLLEPRVALSTAAVGQNIYVFGGAVPGSNKLRRSVEKFDTMKNTVTTFCHLPYEFDSACCVGIKNCIYIFGGRQSGKRYFLNNVYKLDADSGSGQVLRGLPETAAHLMPVVMGNKVILLGKNMTFVYDVDNEICASRPEFKVDVSFFGVLASEMEIIILGGRKNYSPRKLTNEVRVASVEDILNGRASGWRRIGCLPEPMQFYRSQCQFCFP